MSSVPVHLPTTPERQNPPFEAPERQMLQSWLEFHRATLLVKCAGLDDDQLRTRSVPPSSLSLLGLVRHLADVERHWFRRVLAGEDAAALFWTDANADDDFDQVDTADVAADLAAYRAEVDASRRIAAQYRDLADVGRGLRHGRPVSVRWVYVHMIEEYARHNGHADLLRERIDGATGE